MELDVPKLTSHNSVVGAVDIGGTKVAVGIVEQADGQCLWSSEIPTDPLRGPANATSRIAALLQEGESCSQRKIHSIGIGCTGPVDPATGVIGDVGLLPGWEGYPLTQALEAFMNVQARVENDCDAAAQCEARFGVGKGASRFLYVTISTGIGAGFIVDGAIYRGYGGVHPEVGHHTIDPNGPLCYCGATGCWETLASGTAIARSYSAHLHAQSACTAIEVLQKAKALDSVALGVVREFTKYLGIGLGNLITMLAPDVIALGGGVMGSHEQFLEEAVAIARTRSTLIAPHFPKIFRSHAGMKAALVGAACVAPIDSRDFR